MVKSKTFEVLEVPEEFREQTSGNGDFKTSDGGGEDKMEKMVVVSTVDKFKTVAMAISWITMGMFLEVVGPTLPYLKDRVGADYEEISRVLVARGLGYFIGSLSAGYLCDRFYKLVDIFTSGSFGIAAVATALIPFCGTLWLMGIMFFIQGIAQGWICIGTNALCLIIWGAEAGAPLTAQHLGFGIGAFIAPQIANAFVHETDTTDTGYTGIKNNPREWASWDSRMATTEVENITITNGADTVIDENIEWAYLIIACLTLVSSLVFLGFFIQERLAKNKTPKDHVTKHVGFSLKKICSPTSCAGGDTVFGSVLFILLMIFYIHVVGGERAYSKFLYSYAIESEHELSTSEAANINSAFWLAFTAGRGLATLIAPICPMPILLGGLVAMNVVNGIVLAVWANSSTTVLWVFSCSYGLFMAPLFPIGLVWANLYLAMTALAVAMPYVGSSVGSIIYQWLTGYFFEYYGPYTLMYVILACVLNLALIYTIMQIVAYRHGSRYDKIKHQVTATFDDKDIAAVSYISVK